MKIDTQRFPLNVMIDDQILPDSEISRCSKVKEQCMCLVIQNFNCKLQELNFGSTQTLHKLESIGKRDQLSNDEI